MLKPYDFSIWLEVDELILLFTMSQRDEMNCDMSFKLKKSYLYNKCSDADVCFWGFFVSFSFLWRTFMKCK